MIICLLTLFTTISLIYMYFKTRYSYFEKLQVSHPKPSIPLGNGENLIKSKRNLSELVAHHYFHFKSNGLDFFGIYLLTQPIFVLINTELIRSVLTTHFNNFMDRGSYFNETHDPLTSHLFNLEGSKWKTLRSKMTPTFTLAKMKMMFPILLRVGEQMKQSIEILINDNKFLDVKDISARFGTDIIGSCAFGIDCNSFQDPDAEFRKFGKKIFEGSIMGSFRRSFCLTYPNLARTLGVKIIKTEVTKFFLKIVKDAVEYREVNSVSRQDFLQILIEMKNNGLLTMNEVAAQAFLFFFAGFESSSATMTFCLYELARNELIQGRVRDDIIKTIAENNGEFSYDGVQDMKYLSQVINETMRKYPPIGLLIRKCTDTFQVSETNLYIEKGTHLFIPVHALHNDPSFFPNPEKFDPERFSDEGSAKRDAFSYLPFGKGPRNCLAARFGSLQVKIGLAIILKNFRLKLVEYSNEPLTYDPHNIILTPKSTILLKAEKI